MKFFVLFMGLTAAAPILTERLVLESRQILGNKGSLLCQHDHLHLMNQECKSGTPNKSAKSSGSGGGLGKLLGGGEE